MLSKLLALGISLPSLLFAVPISPLTTWAPDLLSVTEPLVPNLADPSGFCSDALADMDREIKNSGDILWKADEANQETNLCTTYYFAKPGWDQSVLGLLYEKVLKAGTILSKSGAKFVFYEGSEDHESTLHFYG